MSTNILFVEMDMDEWFDTYKPIKNHIDENSSFDGCMFETYGDEVEFVKAQDENRIWMYGDGDDGEGHRRQVPFEQRVRHHRDSVRQRHGLPRVGDPAVREPDSGWSADHDHRPPDDAFHDDA